MNPTIEGQILLWDNVCIKGTDEYRVATITDTAVQHKYVPLKTACEITIAGNYTYEYPLLNGNLIFIIPLAGSFTYLHNNFSETCSAGTINIFQVTASNSIYFTNVGDDEITLFIFIFETTRIIPRAITTTLPVGYNNIITINTLQTENQAGPFFIRIGLGIFAGRHKFSYNKEYAHSKAFLWVINGAFEACEVLLHNRDAYITTGCTDVDGEALSNNAAMLFIEFAE